MGAYNYRIVGQHPFMDLNLFQYGYEACDPSHAFGPAKRFHYLFHYVISGKGKLIAQDQNGVDQEYELRAGQGFMIFPDQITTYIADEKDPWEYTWVEFDGMIAKEFLLFSGLSLSHPIYLSNEPELSIELRNTMLNLANATDSSIYKEIGDLYLIIDYINRSAQTRKTPKSRKMSDFYLQEVYHYIEMHYHETLTVESIAEHMNLSRGYLNKIFKEHIGESPKEFIMNYRMKKATDLLETTKLSIGEIGKAIGYPNQLHFSRAFKNYYDVSPKVWRDTHHLQ